MKTVRMWPARSATLTAWVFVLAIGTQAACGDDRHESAPVRPASSGHALRGGVDREAARLAGGVLDEAPLDRAASEIDAGRADVAVRLLARAHAAAPQVLEYAAALGDAAAAAGDDAMARSGFRAALALSVQRHDYPSVEFYGALIRDNLARSPGWASDASMRAAGNVAELADAGQAEWERKRAQLAKALEAGDAAAARDLAEQTLDFAEMTFGANHPNTIRSLRDAADAAFAADDVQGAESQLTLAHERAVTALGANHPDSVDILRTLGDLKEQTGDLPGAIASFSEALEAAKSGLGPRSAVALDIAVALAQVQIRTGLFTEGSKALAATCTAISAEYGRVQEKSAECQTILGAVLAGAGDLVGGLAAYTEVQDIQQGLHGPTHPATIRAEADVAEASRLAGRFGVAVSSLRALVKRAEQLADAELMADVRGYLARALEDSGESAEALRLNRQVYAARVKAYGATDPSSLGALNYIASTQMRMGDLQGAEASYREALAGYQAVLGVEDAATITVLNNLGVLLEQEGLYDEAEPVLRQSLNAGENLLGSGHPTTLRNMNNLALLYESQGNFDKAEALYTSSMRDRKSVV